MFPSPSKQKHFVKGFRRDLYVEPLGHINVNLIQGDGLYKLLYYMGLQISNCNTKNSLTIVHFAGEAIVVRPLEPRNKFSRFYFNTTLIVLF